MPIHISREALTNIDAELAVEEEKTSPDLNLREFVNACATRIAEARAKQVNWNQIANAVERAVGQKDVQVSAATVRQYYLDATRKKGKRKRKANQKTTHTSGKTQHDSTVNHVDPSSSDPAHQSEIKPVTIQDFSPANSAFMTDF